MYSDNYIKQVSDLTTWFSNIIIDLPDLELTEHQTHEGTDSISKTNIYYRKVIDLAFDIWLKQKNYELSYNQLNSAFFTALKNLNKLIIKEE